MSALYPDLDRTVFPEALDQRYIMIDPGNADDLTAIRSYNYLIDAGDMNGAISVLSNNPRLQRMMFNSDKWNRHEDMIIAMERFYQSDVQKYLVNLVVYRGEWNDTTVYDKYNVVIWMHDEAYEAYMATTIVPAGTLPSNTDYWVPITLRGQQGETGVGLSWRGQWGENTEYYADDCVAYGNVLWGATQPSTGEVPSEDSEYWEPAFQIDISAEALLEKLKTVTGDGSGLDADTLDGHDSTYFATADGLKKLANTVAAGEDLNKHIQDTYIHYGLSRTENADGTLYRGTTLPTGTTKLNYSGYFEATRVYGSYYSDYAEFFNADGDLVPGTVVRITGGNRFGACDEDKSSLAIGVVSDDYYMCIGRKPKMNNVPIALAGKVHVRTKGACVPGDMLVSAGDGMARALAVGETAPAGAILGQALDFKAEHDEEPVLMLVMRR